MLSITMIIAPTVTIIFINKLLLLMLAIIIIVMIICAHNTHIITCSDKGADY